MARVLVAYSRLDSVRLFGSQILGSRGPWQGGRLPVYDQEVYVWVTAKPNGILEVTGVSDKKPTTGDYIFARVTRVDNTDVEFKLLFNRVTLDLNKVNPDFTRPIKELYWLRLKSKTATVSLRAYIRAVYL